jgi:hypothetical protein
MPRLHPHQPIPFFPSPQVKSGRFSRVIGADYSESMLRETARRFRVEGMDAPELVRCDAARLPFQTASLDAIHAGAALHCWPALEVRLTPTRGRGTGTTCHDMICILSATEILHSPLLENTPP